MKKLLEILRLPFRNDWWLLIMMIVPTVIPQIGDLWGRTVFHYLGVFIWQFYIVLLLFNLNKKIRRWAMPPFMALFTLLSLVNLTCYFKFNSFVTASFLTTIIATNKSEIKEFFETYLRCRELIFSLAFLSLYGFLFWFFEYKKKIQLHKYGEICFWAAMILNICLVVRYPSILERMSFTNDEEGFFSLDQAVNIKNHRSHLDIKETETSHPTDVIIIIGESFTKTHSSLYGYEKPTCPQQQKMLEDSLLYVFSNVESPSTMTFVSFKYILNEKTMNDTTPWYDSPNVIEAFSSVGYHTSWVSNQQEKGVVDNVASNHSQFCDTAFFAKNNDDASFDEAVLKYPHDIVAPANGRNLIIYHLMGQHESYGNRYPKQWDKFKANNYPQFPEHQRQTISEYDNATIYNDYIVSQIISRYSDRDALVVYFPDHGVDLFESDSDYYGHAKPGDSLSVKAAKQIPLVVYTSALFKERHPDAIEYINKVKNCPLNTESLMPVVLKICNYKH